MSEVTQKVKDIIVSKLGVSEAEVVNSASFTNDLDYGIRKRVRYSDSRRRCI